MELPGIEEVVNYQMSLSNGYVSFPYDCICACGYNFLEDSRALTELITGCRKCNRSFCE